VENRCDKAEIEINEIGIDEESRNRVGKTDVWNLESARLNDEFGDSAIMQNI
jgi:hypothetical protein